MRAKVASCKDPEEAAEKNIDSGRTYLKENVGDKPKDKEVEEDEAKKPQKHDPIGTAVVIDEVVRYNVLTDMAIPIPIWSN